MHRSGKLGLGTAYRQAFRSLLTEPYDRYVAMDADLSHPPESIPDLLRASAEADLVIGSRYIDGGVCKNWSAARLLLSRTANNVARALLSLDVMDATAGFRCYRRELLDALNRINVRSNGYSFQIEMAYYSQLMGFRLTEVPIVFEDRVRAKSKMSHSEITGAIRPSRNSPSTAVPGNRCRMTSSCLRKSATGPLSKTIRDWCLIKKGTADPIKDFGNPCSTIWSGRAPGCATPRLEYLGIPFLATGLWPA